MRTHHLGLLVAALLCASAVDALAVKRVVQKKDIPLRHKFALSIFGGAGAPLNSFESEGNHKEVGGDVAVEGEFFFSRYMSLGVGVTGGLYEDKEFGSDLQTNITSGTVFFRLVGRLGPYIYPYVKGGAGVAVVELAEPGVTFESDPAPSYIGAVGFMIRPAEPFSFNVQATYNYALTKGKSVPELDGELAFDAEYIAINIGVSLFFF